MPKVEQTKTFKKRNTIWLVALNSFLVVMLLFGALLLLGEIWFERLPVKTFVLERVNKNLETSGFQMRCSNVFFRLDGSLVLQEGVLFHSISKEPIGHFEKISCKFSWVHLLFAQILPKKLAVQNAHFTLPAVISPTGLNEGLLENVHLRVNFSSGVVKIQEGYLHIAQIPIFLKGNFKWSQKNEVSLFLDEEKLLQLAKHFVGYKEVLKTLNSPCVEINFQQVQPKVLNINLKYALDVFNWKEQDLFIENLHGEGAICFKENNLLPDFSLMAYLGTFSRAGTLEATNGVLKSAINLNHAQPLWKSLSEVDFSFKELTYEGKNLGSFKGGINLGSFPRTYLTGSLVKDYQWIQFLGRIENQLVDITTSGSVQLDWLKGFVGPLNLEDFSSGPLYNHLTQGNFAWKGALKSAYTKEGGFKLNEAHFLATASKAKYSSLPIDYFKGRIRLAPDGYRLEDFIIKEEGEQRLAVEGSYAFYPKNNNYQLLLKGRLQPYLLNPFLGPWWENFLKNFRLEKQIAPVVDAQVTGSFNDHSQTSLYASIQGSNINYKEVSFDVYQFILKINPSLLALEDLKTVSKNGTLNADLAWYYDISLRPKKQLVRTQIDSVSNLPLEDIKKLANNQTVSSIVQDFNCTKPPVLKVKGTIFPKENKAQDDLTLYFATDSRLLYKGLALDYLNFDALYKNKKIFIQNYYYGFAQGNGEGSAVLWLDNSVFPNFRLTTRLKSSNLDLAIQKVKLFSQASTSSLRQNQPSVKANAYGGVMDLDLKAWGNRENIGSYMGEGSVQVAEANFGKINLFGILSEILSLTPFSLGSYQLKNLDTTFKMDKGVLNFPDLRIYGPSVAIKSNGTLDLQTQELDFLMDIIPVRPRGGIPILSHMPMILAPITQSIQVKVGGTIDKPILDKNLTPFGFFKQTK